MNSRRRAERCVAAALRTLVAVTPLLLGCAASRVTPTDAAPSAAPGASAAPEASSAPAGPPSSSGAAAASAPRVAPGASATSAQVDFSSLGAATGAGAPAACPPPEPRSHCLVFEPMAQGPAASQALIRRAARDGLAISREGELLIARLTDSQIRSIFGGRVTYQREPSSSGFGGDVCAAYLEGTAIPTRYAAELRSVSIGHQICE